MVFAAEEAAKPNNSELLIFLNYKVGGERQDYHSTKR